MLALFKKMTPKEWIMMGLGLGFVILQVWAELELIDFMQEVTMLATSGTGGVKKMLITGAKMLGCALGGVACSIVVGYFASMIAARFSARLRGLVFDKVQSFSMREINRFSTASLITRSTNDVSQMQLIIAMGMQVAMRAPTMAIWAITKIALKSWQWTTAMGIALGLLAVMLTVVFSFAVPRFKKIQSLIDNVNDCMRENLTGLRVVRAYNAEGYQEAKFEKANTALTRNNLTANKIMATMAPVMSGIMSGLSLAIYWIGVYLINAASMQDKMTVYSEMVVFSSYAMQIITSFMMMSIVFILFPRAVVAGNRINEVLTAPLSIADGAEEQGADGACGEVVFDNVSFTYPDAENPVIENISFKVSQGETLAIIGSTGSGKSTVINLIPRFFDVTEGAVYVDGVNVKDYKQDVLVRKIGYVSQRAVLFSGDVTTNTVYGSEGKADEGENVLRALDIASATEFVQEREDKEKAFVARDGANFSGGQKQRLSIARALYKNPEILIFDDSFSALDYKTDKQLRAALRKKLSTTTVIIVAQRIGTIMDADKIAVMDEGRIVGMGTHAELMKSCDVYKEIAMSQLSMEELSDGTR